MTKRIIILFICFSVLSINASACSKPYLKEEPESPPKEYKDITSGIENINDYKHDPYGQVKPLPIEEPIVKKIMAEGVATIFGGNVESARTAALRSAYAEAVARGSGIEIGSMTLIKNVKYVTDIVTSRVRGFVREFDIIREGISEEDSSRYEVLIEAAVVSEGKAQGEEKEALNLYLKLLGEPRLLIILPEKRLSIEDQLKKTGIQEDRGEIFRSTESALAQAFSQYGFQVITSDDLLAQGLCSPEVLSQAKAGVTARALEVARAAEADLALLGVIRITQEYVNPAGVELVMVTGEASAKALIVSSGKLIEAFHRMERASHPQMLKAYGDCLDRIAVNISDVLAWKIPKILTNEYRETKFTMSGISFVEAMDIRDFLSHLPGIEKVRVSQMPTERRSEAVFILMTGYIMLDPLELLEECSRMLNRDIKLLAANKFRIDFKLETS